MKAYVCDVCSKQAPFTARDYELPEGWFQLRNSKFIDRHVCSPACAQHQIDVWTPIGSDEVGVKEPAHVG